MVVQQKAGQSPALYINADSRVRFPKATATLLELTCPGNTIAVLQLAAENDIVLVPERSSKVLAVKAGKYQAFPPSVFVPQDPAVALRSLASIFMLASSTGDVQDEWKLIRKSASSGRVRLRFTAIAGDTLDVTIPHWLATTSDAYQEQIGCTVPPAVENKAKSNRPAQPKN
jgi:hypothetical protein